MRRYAGSETEKYFVATQDVELRRELRSIAGVPVLYLNKVMTCFGSEHEGLDDFTVPEQVALVFEPPSHASQNQHSKVMRHRFIHLIISTSASSYEFYGH